MLDLHTRERPFPFARPHFWRFAKLVGTAAAISITGSAFAADLDRPVVTLPTLAAPNLYNWTGFYAGANLGYNWGKSNWNATTPQGAPIESGSHTLSQTINSFDDETGSWNGGLQAGYNYMLPNRVVIGGEATLSSSPFWSDDKLFKSGAEISVGGFSTLQSGGTFAEGIQDGGAFRAKLGYAPRNWLFYATGGLAWDYELRFLSGAEAPGNPGSYRARLGYEVGGGVEAPLIPNWTAFLEFDYNHYGSSSVTFPLAGEKFTSKDQTYQVRAGINYHPTDSSVPALSNTLLPGIFDNDRINIHEDFVALLQGYPTFRSPNLGGVGGNGPLGASFRSNGEAREIVALDFWLGLKLWEGAEVWANPEINQGFGVGGTVGIADFPNGNSFKIGQAAPYERFEYYFIRQTFNFSGKMTELAAGETNFAAMQSDNRLVITAGRIPFLSIGVSNYFNIRDGFGSWGDDFPISVDLGGDAWGTTYGALVEYYYKKFAVRVLFDSLTQLPDDDEAEEGLPLERGLSQFHTSLELEENHTLFGQPGKFKVLGFIDHGSFANINQAISYYNQFGAAGQPASIAPINFDPVRETHTKPGYLLEFEQHITPEIGFFTDFGAEDGRYEILNDVDSHLYATAGITIAGAKWGRPDDVFGIAGSFNNISGEYKKFLSLGGHGLEVGDGVSLITGASNLTASGAELDLDIYYKYQLTRTISIIADYQHLTNPAFNESRGPVDLFMTRAHFYY